MSCYKLAMKKLLALLTIPLIASAAEPHVFSGSIERFDLAFDALVAPDAKIEKLAEGFHWSEGPTWFAGGVVFSDVPENIAYRWQEGSTKAEIFLKPSGMSTPTEGFREQGSNGLSHDAEGHLILCQHGDRRIARMIAPGKFETIADRYDGKRFSSPNDLAIRKNGDIYFTDPPYGLDKLNDSPLKEMPFNGVYRVTPGKPVALVVKDLTFPNGIAFSPDEKILYIAVSDPAATRIMAYEVKDDGSVGEGRTFFDAEPLKKPELKGACDGMKVDTAGNLWSTGPGGVLVISPAGKLLGRILTGEPTGNCTWGDDGSSLYICANMFLLRVKTKAHGARW